MRWTIAQVAGALGVRAGAGLDPVARVAGVSIDSRTVRAGELFVAVHGPRHDGHDHVASALGRGAIAALVAEPHASRYGDAIRNRCIVVGDTFEALKQTGPRGARSLGRENCRRHRLRGQDHNERDPGGTAGREAAGPEIGRKF